MNACTAVREREENHVALRPLTALHLCSGYGGFELALKTFGTQTVCHVERDPYAAATLVARMEQTRLDPAPIWDDLTTFDGRPWCGRVDLVTAGFPCQPFSTAGQRRGVDDDRWLWPDIARIISEVRPGIVILENVPQLVRHGLPYVLADLAGLGFDAEWAMFAAADVGAPHLRKRFWLLAYASGTGRSTLTGRTHGDEAADGAWHRHVVDGASEVVDDSDGCEQQSALSEPGRKGHEPGGSSHRCGQALADSEGFRRLPGHRSIGDATQHAGSLGHRYPPLPDDITGWEQWLRDGGPQPAVRRSTDGATKWLADALHLGGNGIVPQCGAEAIRQLNERLVARQVAS